MNDIVVASLFRLPFVLVISDEKSSLFFSLANSDSRFSHKMAAPVPYRFSAAIVAVCFVAVCVVYEATTEAATPLKSTILFDVPFTTGRTEAIRLALYFSGMKYEDRRLNSRDILKIESKLPFGKLPVFQDEDKMYHGMTAILTYAGRRANLMPLKYSEEELRVYDILLVVEELLEEVIKVLDERDKHKKYEMGTKLDRETLPRYLEMIEDKLRPDGNDYAVGPRMTVVDLSLYCLMNFIEERRTRLRVSNLFFNLYPKIYNSYYATQKHPTVKKYEALWIPPWIAGA